MGILTGKKASDLLNEENKVNEKYQSKSLDLVAKVQEVKGKEAKTKEARELYANEIKTLNVELDELNSQQIIETDAEKIKELEKKRKEIRLAIQDKEGLINTDPRPYLSKEMAKLDKTFLAAREEYDAYLTKVKAEIEEIDQQIEALKSQRRRLHAAGFSDHKFVRLQTDFANYKKKYESVKVGEGLPTQK